VASINTYLEEGSEALEPVVLASNKDRVFEGSKWLGEGFLLSPREADEFTNYDRRNAEVIFALINGRELNSDPSQTPSRYIIDFRDRTIDEAARYEQPFARVEQLVKPVRAADNRAARRERWWLFAEPAKGLYGSIRGVDTCFACARTSKFLSFSACSTEHVFSDAIKVLTTDCWAMFAVVQSGLHEVWARKYSGSLETRLRYSPSDCFDTFAFPEGLWQTPSAGLADIGARYHEHRRQLMLSLWLGLTDVYNLFHSRELDADLAKHFASRAKKDPAGASIPEEHRAGAVAFTLDAARAGIVELRRLHVELDTAVRDAYGWQDLPLEHDFYEVETLPENDRVRYTISPAARKELLKRLLAENHRRAAAESTAQAQTPPSAKKPSARGRRKAPPTGPSLFDGDHP
jgi:hypothetical protein